MVLAYYPQNTLYHRIYIVHVWMKIIMLEPCSLQPWVHVAESATNVRRRAQDSPPCARAPEQTKHTSRGSRRGAFEGGGFKTHVIASCACATTVFVAMLFWAKLIILKPPPMKQPPTQVPNIKSHASFGWHYLCKATCLIRPHCFLLHYLSNTADRICYIVRHLLINHVLDK